MAIELDNAQNMKEFAAALLSEMNYQKQAQTPSMTMKEFAIIYLERHSKAHNKTWKADESRLRLHILPVFADHSLTAVTTAALLEFQALMVGKAQETGKQGTTQANRCIEQIGTMFQQARQWGYYPEDRRLPTEGVKCFREQSRERYMDHDEVARLAKVIDRRKETANHVRVYFWVDLMTGLRRGELLNAMWSDLDLVNKQLRRPGAETKNGEPLCQPLPEAACKLLDELPRSGPFIFSAKGKANSLNPSTLWRHWDKIRTEANISDTRIHDLRRTVGSWMAQSGESLALVGKTLNHQDLSATKIYARFSNSDVRRALDKHSARIAPLIAGINASAADDGDQEHAKQQPSAPKGLERVLPNTVPHPGFPTLAKAINQCAPHLRVFFWLYFMTGLTKDQLLAAKWTDLDEKTLELKTINPYQRRVVRRPLSIKAVKLLSDLPRHSIYIFASPRKSGAVTIETIKGAWRSASGRARLPGLGVKALQRTAMELAIKRGMPEGLACIALNRTTLAHNRGTFRNSYSSEQIREAVELVTEEIMRLAEHSNVERL